MTGSDDEPTAAALGAKTLSDRQSSEIGSKLRCGHAGPNDVALSVAGAHDTAGCGGP